jgi:3',5'-cyclic AMP phosphodiesterase CpdA
VNVFNFEKMGLIGNEQLAWIKKDLSSQKTSTPIVVFAHVPLYTVYEPWGWMTEDGSKVVSMLQRFDNVTVLNGHIHQVLEHTEGKIRFRTAAGTAYPQPAPGTADAPGPVKDLPANKLLGTIGYRIAGVEEHGIVKLTDTMLG